MEGNSLATLVVNSLKRTKKHPLNRLHIKGKKKKIHPFAHFSMKHELLTIKRNFKWFNLYS